MCIDAVLSFSLWTISSCFNFCCSFWLLSAFLSCTIFDFSPFSFIVAKRSGLSLVGVGNEVGATLGPPVGAGVGADEGANEGAGVMVGAKEGAMDGAKDGENVGG